jgi:MarR family transcriptional regulator, organic hydroperoxide resistance regulator
MTSPPPQSAAAPVRASSAEPVDEFVDALDDFLRAGRRARGRWREESDPLTLSQFLLLEPLVDAGEPVTSGAAAAAAGISAPTATRMLDVLQRKGLVERTRAAEDRRCVLVSPTTEGTAAVLERRIRMHERRARVFERLGPDDSAAAARVLQQLAAAIDDVR